MDKKRSAGILMPVFSLPGEYGIGSFGKDAEEFCVRKKACARIVNDIIFLLVGA